MRLQILVLTLLASLLLTTAAHAQESRFGLGGVIGQPTGVTMKWNIGSSNGIELAAGFGGFYGNHLHIHAAYMWEFEMVQMDRARMDLYVGIGPKIGYFDRWRGYCGGARRDRWDCGDRGQVWFAARAPVGLDFVFKQRPLDVYVELAPGLYFFRHVGFSIDAAAGARYWF